MAARQAHVCYNHKNVLKMYLKCENPTTNGIIYDVTKTDRMIVTTTLTSDVWIKQR